MVEPISLTEGFSLSKFNSLEDMDMVLGGAPWFIHGKLIIFKRWLPDFKSIKEDFKDSPI